MNRYRRASPDRPSYILVRVSSLLRWHIYIALARTAQRKPLLTTLLLLPYCLLWPLSRNGSGCRSLATAVSTGFSSGFQHTCHTRYSFVVLLLLLTRSEISRWASHCFLYGISPTYCPVFCNWSSVAGISFSCVFCFSITRSFHVQKFSSLFFEQSIPEFVAVSAIIVIPPPRS